MKRLSLIFVLIFAVAAGPASAVGDKYVIGAIKGMMKAASSQSGSLIADMVKPLSVVLGAEVEMIMYEDVGELLEAAEKKKVDFMIMFDYTPAFKILMNSDFQPFIGYTLLGMKETRGCLYYRAGTEAESIEDLRGRAMVTYDTDYEYYLLRDLVGGKPEDFFGTLKTSPSGVASIYDISVKGANDAALIWEQNILWVKISNPQAVKSLRKLTCSDPIPFYPLLHSSDVPEEAIKEMLKYFINAYNEESMKRFKPLMRQFKIKFMPVSMEDYEPELKLYKESLKKGWDKDFAVWVAAAEMIETEKEKKK